MRLRTPLCGMLLVMAATLGAGGPDRLTMRVSPLVAFAPADLSVRTTIEANDQNRSIQIIAESADFYRSSEMPLDGGQAPRTAQFELRNLPGGMYTVIAVLKGANDTPLAQTRRDITIVEGPLIR